MKEKEYVYDVEEYSQDVRLDIWIGKMKDLQMMKY